MEVKVVLYKSTESQYFERAEPKWAEFIGVG